MRSVRALPTLLAATLMLGCPGPSPAVPGGSAGGGGGAAAPGRGGPPRANASPLDSAVAIDLGPAPPRTVRVSDVKVGQRYRFVTRQSKLTIHEVWRITRVDLDTGVHYDLTSRTEVEGADPIESGPTPKVAQVTFADSPAPPGAPPVAQGQETLNIGGASFECTIYSQEKTRRWISARFPRLIKVEQGGVVFKELVAIEP